MARLEDHLDALVAGRQHARASETHDVAIHDEWLAPKLSIFRPHAYGPQGRGGYFESGTTASE